MGPRQLGTVVGPSFLHSAPPGPVSPRLWLYPTAECAREQREPQQNAGNVPSCGLSWLMAPHQLLAPAALCLPAPPPQVTSGCRPGWTYYIKPPSWYLAKHPQQGLSPSLLHVCLFLLLYVCISQCCVSLASAEGQNNRPERHKFLRRTWNIQL